MGTCEIAVPVGRIRIRFGSLALGGDAVGRSDEGLAVFVPFGAPGEVAEVEIHDHRRNFARGRIARLVEPSPDRVDPPCPYFGECGGCRFQHVRYEVEVREKGRMVAETLARIGGVPRERVGDAMPAPAEWGYRNRAGFVATTAATAPGAISAAATPAPGGFACGFHAASTHRVVDVARCAIQTGEANAVLEAVRALAGEGLTAGLEGLEVRVNGERTTVVVTLEGRLPRGNARRIAERLAPAIPALGGVLHRAGGTEPETILGSPYVVERIDGFEWRVHAASFFQVNPAQAAVLLRTVLGFAALTGRERVIDLHAGAGFFTVPVALAGCDVAGIEGSRIAARDAEWNLARAREAGARAGRSLHASVEQGLRRLAREGFSPDLVILDPPRAGAREALPALVAAAPARVIYVSCDPATMGRDLRMLTGAGYVPEIVQPIDMFPRTAHIETVALLLRDAVR